MVWLSHLWVHTHEKTGQVSTDAGTRALTTARFVINLKLKTAQMPTKSQVDTLWLHLQNGTLLW